MSESISHSTQPAGVKPAQTYMRYIAIATFVAILCCAPVSATSYGDVDVAIESAPSVESPHGYAEVWLRVTNRSQQEAREVRLTLPQHSYYSGEDYLRAVSRTVTVDPGKTARVALSYPSRLPIGGSGLGVTIDGREQTHEVPAGSFRTSSRYRGSGYSSTIPKPIVLFSRGIDSRFPDWAEAAQVRGGLISDRVVNYVRSDLPAANWSPNWLGYSCYDGVVLSDEDLRSMPDEVRSAIGQYVECGGSLLILGRDPQLPGKWHLVQRPDQLGAECEAGFGTCFSIEQTDLSEKPAPYLRSVVSSWNKVLRPWSKTQSAGQANVEFPIVDDIGVPVGGLLTLMFAFCIGAGPVTLYVLARRDRKLWLFWIIPLISATTCLTVFGYIALSEGWSGRSRIVGVTILDENTRRASSLGWSAFYTPLSAGGGLHFSPNTEVNYMNGDESDYRSYRRRSSSAAALGIDWTNDQHLVSGWLSPRVPAHFIVRKSEIRRERITFSRGADGRPEAVNGLGVNLADLWYADEAGQVFHVQNVAAGSKVSLDPSARPGAHSALKTFSDVYGSDWTKIVRDAKTSGAALLTPRTYLAVMESAPFFDAGLPNAKSRQAQSVVFGIIKEGGDEN